MSRDSIYLPHAVVGVIGAFLVGPASPFWLPYGPRYCPGQIPYTGLLFVEPRWIVRGPIVQEYSWQFGGLSILDVFVRSEAF